MTGGIAAWAAWYYRQHMLSPFDDAGAGTALDIQETTKDAFSSSDEYAPINRPADYDDDDLESRTHFGHGRSASAASSTYNSNPSSSAYDQAHPGRPLSWAAEREPYPGIGGHGHAPIAPIAPIEAMMPDDRTYTGSGRL